MNIKCWESNNESIYIPLECPNCENQVSVSGKIHEGRMELDPCPSCGFEFESIIKPKGEIDGTIEQGVLLSIVKAKITWDNTPIAEEATLSTGDCSNFLEALLLIVEQSVRLYATDQYNPMYFKMMLLYHLIGILNAEQLRMVANTIGKILAKENEKDGVDKETIINVLKSELPKI